MLFLAASNDIAARMFNMSVFTITWVFRIAVIVLPPIAGLLVYRLMRGLALSGAERFMEVPLSTFLRGRPASDGDQSSPRGEPASRRRR